MIGIAFAIRAVLVVLLEIPTGGLADAIGRKPIALASQTATLLSFAFLLVVTGPITLLAYALFQGVGAALHSGALEAWYVDKLKATGPAVDLQKNLATISVAQTAAMLVGAAVGGTLPSLTSGLGLPWPLSGFGVALLAGLALRVVVWWLTVALVEEPEFDGKSSLSDALTAPSIVRDGLRLAVRIPVMPYLLFAGASMGVAMIAIETFWQPIASLTFGADPETSVVYGALGFTLGAAGLLGSLVVMRHGDRFPGGPAALAGASVVVKGGAILLLALHAGGLGVAVGLALAYFAVATQNVPHDTLLNDAVPNERRSILLSINSLVFFLGIAVGSGVLGPLASVTDPRLALAIAGGFTLLAAIAYVGVAVVGRRAAAEASRPAGAIESS
jgi:MFS family permease